MATFGVVLTRPGKNSAPAPKSARGAAPITTSGASQASATAALDGEYWTLATSGDVWVTFGAAPTAAKGTTFFLPAGTTRDFEATAGDLVAVIDNS